MNVNTHTKKLCNIKKVAGKKQKKPATNKKQKTINKGKDQLIKINKQQAESNKQNVVAINL